MKKLKIISTLVIITMFASLFNIVSYASDTNKASDWALAEVNEAKELNLIPEEMMNDDLTEHITRAEFSAIALNLHQAIVGDELDWHGGYIVDIDNNIYELYIRGAYFYGITNGTGRDSNGGVIFSPDLRITREQLATMLCRVVKLNKFEGWLSGNDADFPLDIGNTEKFSDDYQISDYARESVYYMSKHGVIKGLGNMWFAPQNVASKEQAILLALRIYKVFEELPVPKEREEDKVITAERVEISKEKLTLYVGDTANLSAKIVPNDATNQELEWSSSNENIVTVTSAGTLKAKGKGVAFVSVMLEEDNTTHIAQCKVTVLAKDNGNEENTGTQKEDSDAMKRPVVETGSDPEDDDTNVSAERPERPTVEFPEGDDEETTTTRPDRPVVDATVDSDDSEIESDSTQMPSRPTVDSSEKSDEDTSEGKRPSRPSVEL